MDAGTSRTSHSSILLALLFPLMLAPLYSPLCLSSSFSCLIDRFSRSFSTEALKRKHQSAIDLEASEDEERAREREEEPKRTKMATVAKDKGAVPVTRLEGVIDELERENEQLGRELARVTVAGEERTSEGKRKKTEPLDRSTEKALPRLPTEVWAEIAAKIDDKDVLAFASTSKQLRDAQQQAGRKLVTRPWYQEEDGHHTVEYFSRDWCAWWRRGFNTTETGFNTTETEDECINYVLKVAAYHGYFDVLKRYWSHVPEDKKEIQGLLMDPQTCVCAASQGHLEVLKWLRSEGCPWDEETCYGAAWASPTSCAGLRRSPLLRKPRIKQNK